MESVTKDDLNAGYGRRAITVNCPGTGLIYGLLPLEKFR